ncbi:MAG: AAA family ATPase [Alphaproteobacteria bacterium]|nr:AAA family ATPase [Alphaproteobacteria bacterium]
MNAIVKRLICRNFRSYRTLSLNFSSDFVVLYGENGAGKTNVLEALSLFSANRGLRKAPIADLNTVGTPPFSWNLELTVEQDQYQTLLSTNALNGRRTAKADGSPLVSLAKLEEIIWLLWVVPSMDNIFISSQSDLRSFFDHLVSGYDSLHKMHLKELNYLQKERLHVIFFRKDESWLQILEGKIAEKNILITKSRLEFIELLHETFEKYHSRFLRPIVEISGIIESIYNTYSEEEAILEIAANLKSSRYEDSEKQTTTVSAQKSNWIVKHRQKLLDAGNCSTGEQKAFLISLILAVVRIYKLRRKGTPILLLDDLMMHLDRNRRRCLIEEVKELNIQSFFTGTDLSLFSDITDIAQIYHVQNSICVLE